jgi:type 1 fimbria pilin
MGFTFNTSYTSTNNILILPYTCNFNGLQNLNIHLPTVVTKKFNSLTSSISNIIQSLPIQCKYIMLNQTIIILI